MSEHIIETEISNGALFIPYQSKLSEAVREEIVRCRDCKDYRASDATCHSWQWHNWDAAIEVEPDGFCAWAERKEDVDD